MVLFTDATSRVTAYATNQVPALDPSAADGTVVLDFIRAANLPFGYTDWPPARSERAAHVPGRARE
ncbi:DUF1684 domain-containing protein [Streptomyces canus]|uniref:DUF1684 domain-containing protein n=1 Tax=Streptomyces canus TaxID=58343 RepID=UPI003AF3D8EB